MFASLIITLREGLEAGLIISILLAFAEKTGGARLKSQIYMGAALALAGSLYWLRCFSGYPEGYRSTEGQQRDKRCQPH